MTELLSLKLFLSTTPAAALAQVASATTASLTPAGAQLQEQLHAGLASQAAAPAPETPDLTSGSAQIPRQVGHANLAAEVASGPATSSAVLRQAVAASDALFLPAVNATESASSSIAQSSPANAASTEGVRVSASLVQAVHDVAPAARTDAGRALPLPSDADLDAFFLEIWDQDQMLFPDAVPPVDEMLYPGGVPVPDEMPAPPAIPHAQGPGWTETGLAWLPASSQPGLDATLVAALSQTGAAQVDPVLQTSLPGDDAEASSTRTEKTEGAAPHSDTLFPYLVALVGAAEVISTRRNTKRTEEL
ncbi:MAG TPA: hypothetical protein VG099_06800 [Gemmataceae bacterium]|nr:hypothetical protein [Gemmataceae bacterium]